MFLSTIPLAGFGTSNRATFNRRLDIATEKLVKKLPAGAKHWGRARKGLNVFLRECLYTTYLSDAYKLHRAKHLLEVPLDEETGQRLMQAAKDIGTRLPRWQTVNGLTKARSASYQSVAQMISVRENVARVHLDARWWGQRET